MAEFTFKSTVNFKKLGRDKLDIYQRRLERAMQRAAREIVKRTQSGIDADGEKFQDYSPKYKKLKQKKGRTGAVDLTFTGKMLQAITTEVSRQGSAIIGSIKFNSVQEAKKAIGNMRSRKFFALSKEQLEKIKKTLKLG